MSYEMEQEDFMRQRDAEIASLREELHRLALDNEAKDREIDLLHAAATASTRENLQLRKQLQSWADQADEEIRLAELRRAEMEACDL